jgi:outer membrane protein assembly factor BamB
MNRSMSRLAGGVLLVFALAMSTAASAQQSNWLEWRGPLGTGMAMGDAPLRWSDSNGVAWKVAIPGRGHSTPIVVGNRLYLTTAIATGRAAVPAGRSRSGGGGGGADAGLEHRFDVLAIDRATGKTVWQRTAITATPHEGYHRTYGSFASNSPVSDGQRVYVFFGSRGLYAYSLDGDLLWQKDFGVKLRMDGAFGEGTAPVLHDGRLLILLDHLDGGFLAVLDAATGKELLRIPRMERYNWAPPFVATHGGRRQIVINGETTRGYDYETGAPIWQARGLGENSVPQIVQHDDLVFSMSGHTIKYLMGIRLGRKGDLTGTDGIAWSTARGVSYTPSPLLHDGKLYVVSDAGLVSCLDAATGRPFWATERLPKPYNFKASPVGANGKLYLATEEGDVVVLRLGETFNVLATNTLADQSFIASPVIVDGSIYLRSRTHLFRIESSEP